MATKSVEVDVDIDLDDFDFSELLEEISNRSGLKRNHYELTQFCKEFLGEEHNEIIVETVEDWQKHKLISEAFKKYSLTQLEEKLK